MRLACETRRVCRVPAPLTQTAQRCKPCRFMTCLGHGQTQARNCKAPCYEQPTDNVPMTHRVAEAEGCKELAMIRFDGPETVFGGLKTFFICLGVVVVVIAGVVWTYIRERNPRVC
jgi:hypothetical protein